MSTALVHHISGSLAFKRQSSLCSFQLLRRVDEHCATIYILHTHTRTLYFPTHMCMHAHTHTHSLSFSFKHSYFSFRTHSIWLVWNSHMATWSNAFNPFTFSPYFFLILFSHYLSLSLSFSFESSPFVHLYFLGIIFYLCPSVGRLSFLVVENCKSFNLFAHMSCHDRGKNNPPLPAHTQPGQPIAAAYPEKLIKISATNSLEDFPLCQSEAIKFSF